MSSTPPVPDQTSGSSLTASLGRAALALAGVGLFVYVVRQSGMTVPMLLDMGWLNVALVLAVSLVVILLDTWGFDYAVRGAGWSRRPGVWGLFVLRVGGDSLTNSLPGGVVLGEGFKLTRLRGLFGIPLSDGAASLMSIKLALGLSQALYILLGLLFCLPLLAARSEELFGFGGAHYLALALTGGMGLMVGIGVLLMLSGQSCGTVVRALARLPGLGKQLQRLQAGADAVDKAASGIFRKENRRNMLFMFIIFFVSWLAFTFETVVLLRAMGLSSSPATALVLESVGSIFRLVFFLVPSGIGAQDASFLALFALYRFPTARGGVYVLVKRFKEVLWIGVGLLMVLVSRRAKTPDIV